MAPPMNAAQARPSAQTSWSCNRDRGKARFARGMLVPRGRTVLFTDADLAYAPAQIITLLTQIESGWDVVVGNRRHVATAMLVRARRIREIGGRLVNLATHALLLGQYRDTQCGLKAFRSDVARLIFSSSHIDGFAFDVEIFHLIERHRLSLAEVPVTVENSERSTVKIGGATLRLVVDIVRVRGGLGKAVFGDARSCLPVARARPISPAKLPASAGAGAPDAIVRPSIQGV